MGVGDGSRLDALIGHAVGGDYLLRRLIGRGGMGVVYEAEHVRLPRRFAVKFLLVGGSRSNEAMARFRREAEIASQLDSPHIASVVDFNQLEDGTPYFVMDLLEGESLGHRLASRPLERDEILLLTRQIGSALATAHGRGVIHRDLKPENVFLARSDDGAPFAVKLLDFGISKVAGDSMTRTDTILGTPAYMSPEQARGDHRKLDARTDVYSFGALLYEVFAGRCAFPGDNTFEVLSQVALDMPPAIEGAPRAVNRILQRALAKEPSQRPVTALELADEIARALSEAAGWRPAERRLVSAVATGETRAADLESATTAAAVRSPSGGRRSRAWLVGLAAVVLVGAAAAGAALLLAGPPDGEPAEPAPPAAAAAPTAARATEPAMPAERDGNAVAAPSPPERVRIHLSVEPAGARVLLDGRDPVSGDLLEVERSSAPRSLVVRATGHDQETVSFIPDQEKDLAIRLKRRPARHGNKARRGSTAPLIGGDAL